jgi:glycosyltransferase involved in cell wall biosynthesis
MKEHAGSLNILYMLPELTVGGVETHVMALSSGMTRYGHNVTVISNGGALVERLREAGVEHISLPIHRKSPVAINEMARRVREIISDRRIDVVHAHSRVPAWVAHFALRKSKIAFIITAHGQYAPHVGSRIMARGDRIICVSKVILDHMADKLGADRAKMLVIYNGIDIEQAAREREGIRPPAETKKSLGIPEGAPVIGSIGRLTVTKGLRFFVDAFKRVRDAKPGAKAVLVGDGPMRKELQERAAELGIADDLLFTGVRTDIFDLLGIMDVYVVSSLYEGFPMGCLEAMSSRVPIVATRVGGIPEMLDHGRTALLAEPKDPKKLSEEIVRLIGQPELAARLTEAGYQDVVSRFSEKKMLDDILQVYYKTISEKKGYAGPFRGSQGKERSRILLTLPELSVGGVETHVIDLAQGLKRKGYDPLVVSFGGKLVEKLETAGIDHVKLPVHSKSPLVIFNMLAPMRKVIEEHGVQLVHAHSRVPAWICYLTLRAMREKLPFVTTCHSTYSVHIGSRVMVWSDRMIAVSDFVREHMLSHFGTGPELIETVHNGISPDIFDARRGVELCRAYRREFGIGDKTKVVGMVASLTPRKGYVYFIEAARQVVKLHDDVIFLGVGGGPQREELENQAREAGLESRFRFIGVRSDVRDLLHLFDIFVLSSTSEGLPYVILEAMCMGKPIVTTDVGGIPEAIVNGRNGLLVRPKDVDQLARCISELLLDEGRAGQLGQEARGTVVDAFTVSNMVDKTEAVYKKILN